MKDSWFIVNFDEVLVTKTDNPEEVSLGNGASTFEEAKLELVSYWENTLQNAKINLKKAKKLSKPSSEISIYIE